MLVELQSPEIDSLKAEIEAYPRLCGYYIFGLVSIQTLRASGDRQEMILDQVIDYFDDDPRSTNPEFVPDHQWGDYEIAEAQARQHAVESLVGGGQIGHLRETMPEATADALFDRFVALCGSNPRFYVGMGIGNGEYVFLRGVLVMADERAGMLWIVESD